MTESAASRPPDAGLARERTTLAWNRSGLAVIVCIGVLVRRIWPLAGEGQRLALGLVAAAAIVWAVVLLVVTTARSSQESRMVIGPRVFPLMTAGTLLLALVAAVLAFVAPA